MGHFLWNFPAYLEHRVLFLEHLKKILEKDFERFKSYDTARRSHFFLGTKIWGSHYEELLHVVKYYTIDMWEDWHWSGAASKLTR